MRAVGAAVRRTLRGSGMEKQHPMRSEHRQKDTLALPTSFSYYFLSLNPKPWVKPKLTAWVLDFCAGMSKGTFELGLDAQRAQYPLIKEYGLRPRGSLICKGSSRELRNMA